MYSQITQNMHFPNGSSKVGNCSHTLFRTCDMYNVQKNITLVHHIGKGNTVIDKLTFSIHIMYLTNVTI